MIINVNIANKKVFRWSYIWGDAGGVDEKMDKWCYNRVKIYNIIKFNNENSNFYSREKMCEFMELRSKWFG